MINVNIGQYLCIKASEGRKPGIFYKFDLTPRERAAFGLAPDYEVAPRLLLTMTVARALEKGFAMNDDVKVLAKAKSLEVVLTLRGPDDSTLSRKVLRADLEAALARAKAIEDADKPPQFNTVAVALGKLSPEKVADMIVDAAIPQRKRAGDDRPKGAKGERVTFAEIAAESDVDVGLVIKAMGTAGIKIRADFPDSIPAFMKKRVIDALEKLDRAADAGSESTPVVPATASASEAGVITIEALAEKLGVASTNVMGAMAMEGIEAVEGSTLTAEMVAKVEAHLK